MGSKSQIHQLRRLVVFLLGLCSLPSQLAAAALLPDQAEEHQNIGCSNKCGDVTIPYPFGTEGCCLNDDFLITCNTSFTPHKPFTGNIDITGITLDVELHVPNYVGRRCFNGSGIDDADPILTLGKLSINNSLNKFVVVGCDSYGFLEGERFTTGCISRCYSKEYVENGTCDGMGCCKTSIPKDLHGANLSAGSFNDHKEVKEFSPCTHVFLVKDDTFNFSLENLTNLKNVDSLPVVLAWTIGEENCKKAKKNTRSYACKAKYSKCDDVPQGYSGYRCSCLDGYHGDPYRPDGCKDVNECENKNRCTYPDKRYCKNTAGNYTCSCPKGYSGEGKGENGCTKNRNMKIVYVVKGIGFGTTALLLAAILLYLELKRRSSKRIKQKYFLQNGGILLTEKLARRERSSDMLKIFSSSELRKATNDFDSKMIIGQGGFGTVYKGFLPDSGVVAIKRSKRVDPDQIEQFINEVFVLSQLNHRNVVRLIGCCLETEAPLLVYEFISNGTLSAHIHNQGEARFLAWETRLKIAAETAGVLSYLHSAASTPIIHRDVKSDNILLDHTFTAKVSDFGASRLVPLDQTQLSTVVQGTLGYLDPEYMQTHQLTGKSDVYSFGVVLVELLTGRKAISSNTPEEERNLANFFLSILRQERLFEILDDNIVGNANMEKILKVAGLAKGCLNLKGEDRPTMKEVAIELEGLILAGKHSRAKNEKNTEEMESFLDEEGLTGITTGEGSSTSVGHDSITGHVILPMSGGR